MKILMISSYYLPYLAGAELYVKEMAERLVKNGDKAAVLTKNLGNLKQNFSNFFICHSLAMSF